MPTILENKVFELAAGLDEKASQALIQEVDGISAISILHKLRVRAEQGEVNNPSAFVSTAVRSAKAKGGAGPQELEAAIARLSQDGTLDDNAQDVLRKAPPRDALSGLFALLQMDPSAVRNPSAYVTRNVINCKKEGASVAHSQGMGMNVMQGRHAPQQVVGGMMGSQQFAFNGGGGARDLVSKWMPQLDAMAHEKLQRVGPAAAQQILNEMDGKADAGQVRNPSGYVSKACDNLKDGVGPPVPQANAMAPIQQWGGQSDLLRWQGMLDSDALQALDRIGPAKSAPILQNLQEHMGQVRNPSAYVIKSIGNLGESPPPGPAPQVLSMGKGAGGQQWESQPRSITLSALDESAHNALREVGTEAAEMILQELESKGGSVNNPSAYVTRAVMNARRGEGTVANVAANIGTTGSIVGNSLPPSQEPACAAAPAELDEKALAALDEIGQEAASAIVRQLEQQAGKVNNPSAYVLRAVNNARRGKGAGGQAAVAGAQAANGDLLDSWSQRLDADAMSALSTVMPDAAATVLSELESRWGEVNNPSAYVVRAVANFKKGQMGQMGQTTQSVRPPALQQYPQQYAQQHPQQYPQQYHQQMSPVTQQAPQQYHQQPRQGGGSGGMAQLDAKALSALEEVGMAAASGILQKLHAQGGTITNPSAWVIRAVANEKRGGPGGLEQNAAKRMRQM